MKLSQQYRPLIIKEFSYWTLVLNEKQQYLGRCYAWWRDNCPAEGERLRPSELPPDALLELNRTIFADVERACQALGYATEPYGKEFLLNTCYLANLPGHNHHMHWHFIPRTAKPIILEEIDFRSTDHRWGDNYRQELQVPLAPEKLEYIRNRMATSTLPLA